MLLIFIEGLINNFMSLMVYYPCALWLIEELRDIDEVKEIFKRGGLLGLHSRIESQTN
jgi:hypothetical protein